MKSVTIHNIDDSLDRLIRKRAKNMGTSLNKTIKSLLKESLGIHPRPAEDHRDDFLDLFDTWSEKDVKAFTAAIDDLHKINSEDWQ